MTFSSPLVSSSLVQTVVAQFAQNHRLHLDRLMSSIFYEDLAEEFAIHLSTELGVALTGHQVYQFTDDAYIDQILFAYAQATPSDI